MNVHFTWTGTGQTTYDTWSKIFKTYSSMNGRDLLVVEHRDSMLASGMSVFCFDTKYLNGTGLPIDLLANQFRRIIERRVVIQDGRWIDQTYILSGKIRE